MVQILTVANGTALLRRGIGTLHADGYRVVMYNTASVRDLRYAAPDLLIVAAGSAKEAWETLDAIRADPSLHTLPVIVVGETWETFAPLPVALLTETVVLPAPVDETELRDATRMFVPTLVRGRRHDQHAVA